MDFDTKISSAQKSGDVLQIKFPATISNGTIDSLTVFYHGIPPSSGFGSFAQTTHGSNIPVVWTLSEPYGSSDWWPCKNTLTDKADSIDVYVNVPSGNKAASNGLLKQIIPQGANNIYHWKHRYHTCIGRRNHPGRCNQGQYDMPVEGNGVYRGGKAFEH